MDHHQTDEATLALAVYKVMKTMNKIADEYKHDYAMRIIDDILMMIDETETMWEEEGDEYNKEK